MRIKPTQHKRNQRSDAAASNPLMFVASERVIVCTFCKVAVPFQNLDTHLRVAHKLHFRTRRTIVAQFHGLPAAQTIADLEPRRDRSAPLSYIAPPTPGYTRATWPNALGPHSSFSSADSLGAAVSGGAMGTLAGIRAAVPARRR